MSTPGDQQSSGTTRPERIGKAAEWRAKLEAWQASTQPAPAPTAASPASGARPDQVGNVG